MSDEEYFKEAGKQAKKSLCPRDKCGAVLVLEKEIIGRGFSGATKGTIHRSVEEDLTNSRKPKLYEAKEYNDLSYRFHVQ